ANSASLMGTIKWIAAKYRRCFAEAVPFNKGFAGHFFPANGNRVLYGHAATYGALEFAEIELCKVGLIQQAIEQRINARHERKLVLSQFLYESLHVAGIRDQDVFRTHAHHEHTVHRECKNVVHGNGRDYDFLT